MKHRRFLKVVFTIVVFLAGCTVDSRYLSEKLLWKAKKEHAEIIKKSKGELSSDDYDRIINAYRRVIERVPLERAAAEAGFIIAGIYFIRGDFSRARQELRNVINNFSSQGSIASEAYFSIGRIFEKEGNWKEARNQYEQIVDLYPLSSLGLKVPIYILAHYQRNQDSAGEGKAYKWALRSYNATLQEYKGTTLAPVVKDYIARLHLQKGLTKKALTEWDSIIHDYEKTPFAAQAFLMKAGVLSAKLKDNREAIKTLEEFLRVFPGNRIVPEVKLRLGGLYFGVGDIDKAEEVFSQLSSDKKNKEPVRLNAYLGLSYCYRKEADTSKLLAVYDKIKEEFPGTKAALSVPFLIGQYYERQKMNASADKAYAEGIAYYKDLLSRKSNKLNRHFVANLLALCYLKKNEVEKAENLLRQLSDEYPSDPVYLFDLARLYLNLNATDRAITVYKELIEKYPDNKVVQRIARARISAIEKREK